MTGQERAWVLRGSHGGLLGVVTTREAPTEDGAWTALYGSAGVVAAARERGCRLELTDRERLDRDAVHLLGGAA